MNNPFFSIIVPVYNVEKYLSVCLDSVLNQSFSDYEIILIDDGSKDSSGSICDLYSSRYPSKIITQHKDNRGQMSARVAGLQLAKGHYICFLDSDDCWENDTLNQINMIIEKTNSDVVFFRWNRIDENGKRLNDNDPALFPEPGILNKKAVFERLLSTSRLNSFCIKCCRYSLFDMDADYSQYYNVRNGEDLIQSLPVLYRANTFYYLDEPLYLYRVNTASITHAYRKGQHQTMNVVRPFLYSFIEKMGLDTEDNKKAFFQFYLSSLWENINAAYNGIPLLEEREAVLNKLRSYEFVQRGREYLPRCKFPIWTRLGLSAFYRNNKMLQIFMIGYMPLLHVMRGIRSLVS